MAKKDQPQNFGEGFAAGFQPMFRAATLQSLHEILSNPPDEREAKLEHVKAQTNLENKQASQIEAGGKDQLNPQEQLALEKIHNLAPGALKGVRRQIIQDLLPRSYYDPATGQVIKTDARARLLPPAPVAIDQNTGAAVSLPRGAKVISSPGSANAQNMLSKINSFDETFAEYVKILDTIPSGRILGAGADLLNKYTGMFPQIKGARALEGLMTPMAARVIGGDVGNLSELEQKQTRDAVKLMDGTIDERKRGISLLRGILKSKRSEMKSIATPGMFRNQGQPAQQSTQEKPQQDNNDPLGIR